MNPQQYNLIAKAIHLLCSESGQTLSLEDLAKEFELSPSHLQKLFKQHVGISPKQFQQHMVLEQAKHCLADHSILDTSLKLDLSGPSRLHDAFVQIEAMTPGEFKTLGSDLNLSYCEESSIFGSMLAVSTERGLFYLGLHDDPMTAIEQVKQAYPKASYEKQPPGSILGFDPISQWPKGKPANLHVSATNFQIQVWKALLHCESGLCHSYQSIAQQIAKPSASRAVGTAIGANPVAFLIPCHRVIRQSGALGGYRWGIEQKQALLSWETALHQT